ncbi:hypothetical protein FACS189459_0250 [Bacilli bacterium]|nr:hypothetical protein FACS189459_0250 [Bacilli bacterium]
MRCLESNLGGFAQDSTSFDFTKSGGDLNTFFTSNENEILLQMAEKAIDDNANGDNAPTDKKNNIFYDIFGPSTDLKTDVFTNFYNTVEALQAITM